MAKPNFFKLLMVAMSLGSKLAEAAEDGKITVDEALEIIASVASDLGFDFGSEGVDVI